MSVDVDILIRAPFVQRKHTNRFQILGREKKTTVWLDILFILTPNQSKT